MNAHKIENTHTDNVQNVERTLPRPMGLPKLKYREVFPKPIEDWLKNLDEKFFEIIFENMDSVTRDETAVAVQNHVRLSPKQNSSLINSLNFHTFKLIGAVRPDQSLCRVLATILKNKLPETYLDTTAEDGVRRKGEGGKKNLSTRMADCFYNVFIRPTKKK